MMRLGRGWWFATTMGLAVAWPAVGLAQNYGAGSYGSALYSNGVIQIGPITLPATGAGWLVAGLALVAAGVAGVVSWRRQRRSRSGEGRPR